ncbi:transcription termination factor Rho [Propioniciclava soli]|uniref:Transcription termination factor Rho n=1 Tax=Propioniciclava soli TaxID=2775081 RepID=A0ABZ3C2R1_9ACTN
MTNIDSMLLPDLKKVAASLGLRGASGMRKAELVSAIRSAQGGGARDNDGSREQATSAGTVAVAEREDAPSGRRRARREQGAPGSGADDRSTDDLASRLAGLDRLGSRSEGGDAPADGAGDDVASRLAALEKGGRRNRDGGQREGNQRDDAQRDGGRESGRDGGGRSDNARTENGRSENGRSDSNRAENNRSENNRSDNARSDANRSEGGRGENNRESREARTEATASDAGANDDYGRDDDLGGNSRRNRRRRNRDRNNNRRTGRGGSAGQFDRMESDPTVTDDDVLVTVSGILDVLDSYAFVRTSGYLPGPNDAYVSLSMVRKHGLRKGDIVTGAMRAQREGERQKFSPLVRIDTVNAGDPMSGKDRPEFNKLTPLYPQERLRLETTPTNMTGRIIDLVAPIGKGQRGLIVSPPKAGKTMVMQSIANAIAQNNPEVHLMVVLVDERPEEVTDFQRSVQGEVIASTFDRPADDHTTVAELAIERAKRLVESGRDVVILLDGITRLSRAYNLAAPASGRILSGGVDSAALYPPKRFFGAARNVENGGSLTILATALVETGSKMDDVIFEEFKGTGNMELRLRREMADKRIFPAIDAVASGTRREEQLLTREELAIMWKLRRVLSGLEDQAALEMLINRLKKTQTNLEFLHVISRTTPSAE